MLDMKLLKACMASRRDYDKIAPYMSGDELSPQAKMWWALMEEWYKADRFASAVDPTLVRERGKRHFNPKYLQDLLDWYDEMPEVPSATNVVREAIDIKLWNAEQELNRLLADPSTSRAKKDKALKLVQELSIAESLSRSEVYDPGDDYLADFEVLDPKNKISLAPKALNSRCKGGAVWGDHIVLFGPTEIGKSLFAINMAAHFLRNNRKVLYIGNEDNIHKVRMRIRSNLANMTEEQMHQHRKAALQRAAKMGMTPELLMMKHLKPGFISDIHEYAEEFKPAIIVLDQFRNLGGKNDSLTQKMNDNAIAFRSLISHHQAVGVSLAQAHAGEHGKQKVWYEYDDIDSSRTGLPAQADLIVGIGADDDMLARGTRAISLCKNKLGDIHEGFMVRFDHSHSRVTT